MRRSFLSSRDIVWRIATVLGALVQFVAFRPGIMVWDAIRQYGEALSGRYDDWHPPAMDWLWRQLGAFGPGPAPMLVPQVALYWGGLALIAGAAARDGRRRTALAVALIGWLPVPFLLVGTILKDSLMAGALLVAAGLAVRARPAPGVAMALLVAAATLRFNAVPACLPLALMAVPAGWRASRWRAAAVMLVAAGVLVAALPLANRALDARRSGVELSLILYDLGGIARHGGGNVFPPTGIADPAAVAAGCWSPVSWDSYAWWGPDPCPLGFEAVRRGFARNGASATRWWLAAIAAHPLAYAEHRLAHADRNLRFLVHDGDLPALSTESDPNRWGYRVAPGRLRTAIDAVAAAALRTPLGWPICWLAVAAGSLMLRPRGVAAALAWSALLYGLSYVPLSVASEVRYHFWPMTAAALAAVLTLGEGGRSRRQVLAAATPFAVVTMLAVLARL